MAASALEGWGSQHDVKDSRSHTEELLYIVELERRPQAFQVSHGSHGTQFVSL